MADSLLKLENVTAGYGDAVVLHGISMDLPEHGSLAVLGRNGVGKSTLLLTIMGYTQLRAGRITWRGQDISRVAPHRRAVNGIGWVAQEREIFSTLTVEEKPHRRRTRRTLVAAARLRAVSAACRTPAQSRQSAVRWRAANAGNRACAHDQSGVAVA